MQGRIMTTSQMRPEEAPVEETIAEQLQAIDTSVLDHLLDLRKDEIRIEEFRQRTEKMKDAVDPVAWTRVFDDYGARLVALAAQAGPLKQRVRLEYAKLYDVMNRLSRDRRVAEIEKAEFELRHAVGELSDDELASMLTHAIGVLARCTTDDEAVATLRVRFVEAFGDEQALDGPEASPDETPFDAAHFDETNLGETNLDVATDLAQADTGNWWRELDVDPSGDEEEHTLIMMSAALLINGDEAQHYLLAPVNYLGRAKNNDVKLDAAGVSRRHAVIIATSSGFTIEDLSSQNGVFVNGERVTSHALADGEQIAIGDSSMLFRMPWPVPSRP
jgi:hypothetical protein